MPQYRKPTDSQTETATNDLARFRSAFYGAFTKWSDALFELSDALLDAQGVVGSVPSLSLEPIFRRSHGSLYKALALGEIDEAALRALLVVKRPKDWPAVFAVDASTWERSDAECSPERGFYHSASKHSAGQPIVAGWSYQWIAQVKRRVELLEEDSAAPLFVFDAGYGPIAIGYSLKDTAVQVLVRLRSDRVFYTVPPGPSGFTGTPLRRHGRRFKLSDPGSAPRPDAECCFADPRYGTVHVRAWHGLHPRLSGRGRWAGEHPRPIVIGHVIRIDVEHLPKHDSREKKTLWLWWSGDGVPELDLCWRAYLRRFDIEHTFRFVKNTLGWTAPSLCTPEQANRWPSHAVAAYTQLRLAHGHGGDLRLPRERPTEPAFLTLARARRGPRTRHPVVKKAA